MRSNHWVLMEHLAKRRVVSGRLAPRVAIGGISHETNTFSPRPTTLDAFKRRSYLVGDAIIRQSRWGESAVGGMVDAAAERGVDVLPTLFASAPPGGIVTAEAFEHVRERLLDRLQRLRRGPWPLHGVMLSMHGAMVAEGEDDADGRLLADVRSLVGAETAIVVVVDSQANLSPTMLSAADVLLGYDTYPHVDLYERGEEAVERFLDLWSGRMRPESVLRMLPLLVPLPAQRTDGATAMRDVLDEARAAENEPDVVAVTVAGGFPYGDTLRAGASVAVTTNGDAALARQIGDRVAAAIWLRRDRLRPTTLTPDEAIDRVEAHAGGGPVVLADVADNPGAGAPGDGTRLLERLLDRHVGGTVVGALPDPAAVDAAVAAGVGATVRLTLGGKADPRGGAPLDLTCQVQALSDGVFTNRGPMGRGGLIRLGRTAALAVNGLEIVVCEQPVQASDPELFRAVGIDPASRRVVVVKSSVHYRAAFGPLAAEIIEVEAGGLSSTDLTSFPYQRVRRPIVPLDGEDVGLG